MECPVRDRQRDRQRRAVDAARALDVEQTRRERRARAARAYQRLRPALGDRARGLHDRGLGRAPHRAHGIGALRDRDRRVHDLDAVAAAVEAAPQLRRGPEQQHPRALRRSQRGAGGDLGRAQVGAVAIDRHDRRGHRRLLVVVVVLAWSCVLCTTTSLPA